MLWEHKEIMINLDGEEGRGFVLGKVLKKKRYFTQILKDHKELN